MACRGVFFALDEKAVQLLKSEKRSDIVEYLQENIEEVYFADYPSQVAEIDKAWDAAQRAFSESELDFIPTTGTYPGNIIVLGGEVLYGDNDEESGYIITLKTPTEVADICHFLSNLSEAEFRELYFKIDADKYEFGVDEQDFKYTWDWLIDTLKFWKSAAEKKQWVIFSVDQ